MTKRKIALFGGSFDPIHLGHTAVASAAAQNIGAEKVIIIPAKRSPLKSFFPIAGDYERVEMIKLATADDETFQVCECELGKSDPGYTLHTVRELQKKYGLDAPLYWLLGADSIGELRHWYKITALIDECNLCTLYRAGCEPPDFAKFKDIWGQNRIDKLQKNIIQTPLIDISSTEIRKKIPAGEDVSEMLHPAVKDYIFNKGLYQAKKT